MSKWRCRCQYSLRTLVLACTFLAVLLAWATSKANRQRRAVAFLKQCGDCVLYDYEQTDLVLAPYFAEHPPTPPGPKWLRQLLGVDYFANVVYVQSSGVLSDADLRFLHDVPELEVLHFTDRNVSDDDVTHISSCHRLKRLTLNGTNISKVGLLRLCALKNLELLDLHNGGQFEVKEFERPCELPNLKALGIPENIASEEDLRHMKRKFPSIFFYLNQTLR